jgi:hypothetical protein
MITLKYFLIYLNGIVFTFISTNYVYPKLNKSEFLRWLFGISWAITIFVLNFAGFDYLFQRFFQIIRMNSDDSMFVLFYAFSITTEILYLKNSNQNMSDFNDVNKQDTE